jgi:hypothetical protein
MQPEHETPHLAHHTGHRWLDLTLALCAMFISIVSLALAVHHGNAMDRLVNANSWPFLTYQTDNEDAGGHRRILLKIENAGVGPARIETFEVWWQGQPVASAGELLRRCSCDSSGRGLPPMPSPVSSRQGRSSTTPCARAARCQPSRAFRPTVTSTTPIARPPSRGPR